MSTVKTETVVQSFLKELYKGNLAEDLVFPYPEVPDDVKETVTAFADAYRDFDAQFIDSEKIDAEHFFPRDVVKGLGDLGAMGMAIPEEYGGSGFSATAYCPKTERIACRCVVGKRCLYRFRCSSVQCPVHSSISRWSVPLLAQREINEWRKMWYPRITFHLVFARARLKWSCASS